MSIKLADYDIDPERGFLPAKDPAASLPPAFADWEAAGAALPALLLTGQVRPVLARLGQQNLDQLDDGAQLERAFLIISALGMGYVWGGALPARRLPGALALPWQRLADRLGRPPIITHASIVLNNWRRLDPAAGLTPDNLACRQLILGGQDEQWFFTTTVAVEATGAAALLPLLQARQALVSDAPNQLTEALTQLPDIFHNVLRVFQRMYEKCDPYIFFHRIRPFLAGWDEEGIVYEGVSDRPRMLHGGSAAQSSLIQAFDAALGIEHLHPQTRPFLTLMRDYMPPRHRAFVERLAQGPSLYDYVQKHQASMSQLADAFNACIDGLDAIRKAHMEMAVRYIVHQSAAEDEGGLGTGGTSFVPFLSESAKETRGRRL